MRTSGGTFRCPVCKAVIGTYGRWQHYNKHVKEGKMTKRAGNARWDFYVVGVNKAT